MVGGEDDYRKGWQLAARNQAIRHCRVKRTRSIVVTCSPAAIRVSKGMSAHLLPPCQLSEFLQAIMQTGLASLNQGHSAEAPSVCLASPSPSRARRLASHETSRCFQSTWDGLGEREANRALVIDLVRCRHSLRLNPPTWCGWRNSPQLEELGEGLGGEGLLSLFGNHRYLL
jgi:hypothetical protein